MAHCRACGGKLGLDCFNEADCLQISENNHQHQEQEINYLQNMVDRLKYQMNSMGILYYDGIHPEIEAPFKQPVEISFHPNIINHPQHPDYLPF